jgi:2-polyprenyl-3-methyl-5-hydroxy-6-metoxy-1,4-benzoquinol methylase
VNQGEIEHLESFNEFYEKGDPMDRLMLEREMEIVRRYASGYGQRRALEVGCGDGLSTQLLSVHFPNLEVVEASRRNIELLRRRLPDVTCHNVLLEDFESAGRFDLIFFLNVIEHVEDPVQSLRKLTGLLRHEGLIFISAPNCMALNRRAGYHLGMLPGYEQLAPKDIAVGHRRLYTVDMLQEHCSMAGLRVLEMKGLYLKPLSERQMIELGDDVVRAFYSLGEDVPQYCASLLAIATHKHY